VPLSSDSQPGRPFTLGEIEESLVAVEQILQKKKNPFILEYTFVLKNK
jgi:hypothetical protein